ncbi:MAG: bile acid:sodium symporter family protein [Bacteroidales bacterium]|jgi:BASS family bile acid:Na+ symporter|nr:bile acid:sodium symporter family protein [Bacteroidales bacterium]
MYEQLQSLDHVRINFSAGGMQIVNIVLAFVMFGVALGLRMQVFRDVLRHPKSVWLGLISQLVALPAVTFLVVVLLSNWITPMVAMGMILVAACPGGNISNFMSQFSRANTELSVSLTAATTVLSPITTPFNFSFWGGMYVNYVNKHAHNALQELTIDNFQMFETVLLLLGVPLVLGMLTVRFLPKVAEKLKKPMQYFSIIFFVIMIVMAFSNNLELFLKHILFIFVLVLMHNFFALGTGFGFASLFKLPEQDRRTLTIETGIQNSGLGLVLLFNPKIFSPDMAIGGMLFITAWWGIWHIISGLLISSYWSRHTPKINEN